MLSVIDLETKKHQLVCFKGGYHGDTFGAMSTAGRGVFNKPFWPFLFDVIPIDPPYAGQEERSLQQLEEAAASQAVAGFIFEPLIQGVGGMKIHSLQGLDRLVAFCQSHGILTIADEVMTGFGRTGPLFVCQQMRHPPDILCLAKGLTGGVLPLAATVCTQAIFDGFLSHDRHKALLHGHSYFGNPIACAVALASLDLLEGEKCQEQRLNIEKHHQAFIKQWQGHPSLERLENVGTILIMEFRSPHERSYFDAISDRMKHFFFERRILVRPLGNVLHVMTPYCIEENDLQQIYQAIIILLKTRFL